MTREEALALASPNHRVYGTRQATGTDGSRWYLTARSNVGPESTYELLQHPEDATRIVARNADALDPPGVDWVPGYIEPDPVAVRRVNDGSPPG